MKLTQLLVVGGLAASLALPLSASAQQSPQPPPGYPQQQGYPQQGYPQQGYPQPGYPQNGAPRNQVTPSVYQLQAQFARQFQSLGLNGQQQAQISSLINTFAQSHPQGSPRDRTGMKELREQVLSVLTPQQQAQYEQMRAAMAVQRAQRRQQRLMQQQGQVPQGQPPYQGQAPQGQPQQPEPQPPSA